MNYHFEVKVTPFDFFKMSMKKTYTSPIGICNIVFTIAAFLLTAKFYSSVNDVFQLILVLMCLVFTVFQPLGVYIKAKSQVAYIPKGLTLDIDNTGMVVTAGEKNERIAWSRIKNLIDVGSMLIIKVDDNNGYFLTNRVLGDRRKEFKDYILSGLDK